LKSKEKKELVGGGEMIKMREIEGGETKIREKKEANKKCRYITKFSF